MTQTGQLLPWRGWARWGERAAAIVGGMGVWLRLMLGVLWLAACETESRPPPAVWVDPETIPPEFQCDLTPNQRICNGHWSALCDGNGRATETTNCRLLDLTCAPGAGCRRCVPNAFGCSDDNEVYTCNAEGDAYEVTQTCALGTVCNAAINGCIDLCAEAEQNRSYVGCDYWATVTSNSQLTRTVLVGTESVEVFTFELVISNPHNVTAVVTITQGNTLPIEVEVEPTAVERVPLPWIEDLVGTDDPHTTHAEAAAYHIESSVPVTVYQFNPMEFTKRISGVDVPSHTNDASLLLPTHVLSGNYTVVSRPTLSGIFRDLVSGAEQRGDLPGFVTIVAADEQDVSLEITSSAFTTASPDGRVPALSPGQTLQLLLSPGDVVQIQTASPEICDEDPDFELVDTDVALVYCRPHRDYDLSGTTIRADGRVAVFAGHDCSRVPYNVTACDHLEEALFPEESWGKSVPVAVSSEVSGQREAPDVVVVLSGADGNQVTFQPAVHAPITLARGESVELVADRDFMVTGSEALLVSQLLVGQDYGDVPATIGDPAMSLAIPSEQWRNNYAFMIPSTYEVDFVNVIAPTGAPVTLDDNPVTTFTPIEGTSLSTARVRVSRGQHRMSAPVPFGITVYGFAQYTSYAYPGGLDLRVINGPD